MARLMGFEPISSGLEPDILAVELSAHIGACGRNRTNKPLVFQTSAQTAVSYPGKFMVGGDGVEPPEPEGNRFTVCPAATYGISSHVGLEFSTIAPLDD